jgi:DNA-binding GntR family transcriptional regulator
VNKRKPRPGRLSEQVVAEIERMILEQYREPGTRLPKEFELADRFRVSRIVIREAMKIREERGVVDVRAGRDTITAARTPARVKDSLLRLFQDQPIPTLSEMELMLECGKHSKRRQQAWQRSEPPLRISERSTAASLKMALDLLTQVFIQQIKLTDIYTVGVDLHRYFRAHPEGPPAGARQAVRRLMRGARASIQRARFAFSHPDGR